MRRSNVSSFACTVDGSPVSVGNLTNIGTPAASGTFSVNTDGTHPISCTAADSAGNSGAAAESSNTGTVKIDTVAPTVAIGSKPLNPSPAATPASFTFSGGDAPPSSGGPTFQCKLDGGAFADCTSAASFGVLAAGGHTFTVKALDGAGNSATDSWSWVVNAVPGVTNDGPKASSQYSDYINPVTVTATDDGVPGTGLSATTSWKKSTDSSYTSGLPGSLSLSANSGGTATSKSWTLAGTAGLAAGMYNIKVDVSDGLDISSTVITITITQEDAGGTITSGNPGGIAVSPGETSYAGPLTVIVTVNESYVASKGEPNPKGDTAHQAEGDIRNAVLGNFRLEPVGPGSLVPGSCSPNPPAYDSSGYGGTLTLTCTVTGPIPLNTYSIVLDINGSYYTGTVEDVLTVYDPSLGFTTGGGWFYWPGTADPDSGYPGDKTNFGFNMKYNKKGANPQGNVLVIRHRSDDTIVRMKSNAVDGFSLSDATSTIGWASISGKSTYFDQWTMTRPEGNHDFAFYVEDQNEPGTGADRAWVRVVGGADLSLQTPASGLTPGTGGNAQVIGGGNIVVPHTNSSSSGGKK